MRLERAKPSQGVIVNVCESPFVTTTKPDGSIEPKSPFTEALIVYTSHSGVNLSATSDGPVKLPPSVLPATCSPL